MQETTLLQVRHLIPSIKENIGIKKAEIDVNFYEVSKANRMLMKVNEDVKRLLTQINGKNNIYDIANYFNPPNNDRDDIIELVYQTLLKLKEKEILDLSEVPDYSSPINENVRSFLLPVVVVIELTNKCNLSCRYCYQNSDSSMKNFINDPIMLLSFLKQQGVKTIELTGGEPTLHPQFLAILDYIVDNFENYSLLTNGTLLNDKILQIFRKGKGAIQICIDSSEEKEFELISGTTGLHAKIINSVKRCVAYDIPIRVGMVLDDAKNIKDIENVLLLAKNLGAKSFVVNPSLSIGRGKNLSSFNDKEIEEFTLKHNELILKYPDFYGIETVSWSKLEDSHNCGAGSNKITVSWDGSIKLCPYQDVSWLNFGNVYDIKNDEVQKKIKTAFELPSPSKEICTECINTYYCMKCLIRPLNLIKNKSIDKKECKWFSKHSEKLKVLEY
ncbi:MAG TPA: radical SAM protein [Ignavibacteriaceae bacterium]|nr:radical SAM protein [Ignavibacteriaceae bacterium]